MTVRAKQKNDTRASSKPLVEAPLTPLTAAQTDLEDVPMEYNFSSFDESKCDDGFPSDNMTTAEKCYFVSQVCKTDRLIDYMSFRYCTLGDNTAAIVFGLALLIIWLVALFYILGEAAEAHFCPMLSEISSALKMSPDLAGMSILAFGNGFVSLFPAPAH